MNQTVKFRTEGTGRFESMEGLRRGTEKVSTNFSGIKPLEKRNAVVLQLSPSAQNKSRI